MERIRRGLIRPKKLLQVEPYKVVLLWSNREIRINDFSEEVDSWKNSGNKYLTKLASPRVFMTAFIKENTLAFSGIKIKVAGIPGTQPLDLDPDVLYQNSRKIGVSISPEEVSKPGRQRKKAENSAFEIILSERGKSFHFSIGNSEVVELSKQIKAFFIQLGNELIKIEN